MSTSNSVITRAKAKEMINKEEDQPTTINADQAEESSQPNNSTGSGQPTNAMAPQQVCQITRRQISH